MKCVLIVLLSVGAAVLYGIVHDQITIRVCPAYFTVAHPHLIDTGSLTVLALAWGVVATWWVGLPLGLLLAASARFGRAPKVDVRTVARRILGLLIVMGALAAAGGGIALLLGMGPALRSARPDLANAIAPEWHDRFMGAWVAHSISYAAGALGGIGLAVWIAVERGRAAWRATGERRDL